MENRRKAVFVIIVVACLVGAATGIGLRRNENVAARGKHHKIIRMEIPEEISEEGVKERARKKALENSVGSKKESAEESDEESDEKGADELSEEEEWAQQFLSRYQGDFEKECELDGGRIRFRMVVMDAALGSRWYGLLKSSDRGLSWQVVSDSPFGGDMGMGVDFTFLNEDFGFATLAHNGGDEADLYVTEDGGKSYRPVAIESPEVTLENGYQYRPYDFPQMPYEEDGKLYVLCGQGADGDYAGGDDAGMALFESADGGHTFIYKSIKEGDEK